LDSGNSRVSEYVLESPFVSPEIGWMKSRFAQKPFNDIHERWIYG
jgi:hypothetical protein